MPHYCDKLRCSGILNDSLISKFFSCFILFMSSLISNLAFGVKGLFIYPFMTCYSYISCSYGANICKYILEKLQRVTIRFNKVGIRKLSQERTFHFMFF